MASKVKKEKQTKAGFDPGQYRVMMIMFIILSLVNVACVLLAFWRTGFGLYHAESAMAHVADITQNVHSINESAQNIVIHCDDHALLESETTNIQRYFEAISAQTEEYRQIDLNKIDPELQYEFNHAILETLSYQRALNDFTDELRSKETLDGAMTAQIYTNLIEPMKTNAENSMNTIFIRQSEATYNFFVRSAQQFLFVLLFLFITMTVGIIGIRRMRKTAKEVNEQAELEHERAQRFRAKSEDIAYSHIVTGFKNYYGLEKDLTDYVAKKEFTIMLCRFNKFSEINEIYGRSRADEFLASVGEMLSIEYAGKAGLYSTANDEFCFVLHKRTNPIQAKEFAEKITERLSKEFNVDGIMLQRQVLCCYYICYPDSQDHFAQMFCTLDRAMSVAKAQNAQTGQNAIVNVNSLA